MSIRLLTKQEIQKAKSVDRQREIDEGLKLARKVDALRAVLPQEEKALEDFRRETLIRIQEEITQLASKRDAVQKEVAKLQKEREKALEPIDRLWKEVDTAKQEADARRRELDSRNDSVSAFEKSLAKQEKEISNELLRASNFKAQIVKELKEAEKKKKEAEKVLDDADKILGKNINERTKLHIEIAESYKQLEVREKEVIIREELNAKELKFIKEETARLQDQRKTLERAFKRLNNKRG